ncbi:hypothetical protein [Halomarina rubra]|uniref:Zinc ribbon domain-containing protein n=1 Tax=Halomarina rubra TaxID=2071873 RepID=A0ABD6B098_9EURY|nr:hypothetical protein [Halomarina rubra]
MRSEEIALVGVLLALAPFLVDGLVALLDIEAFWLLLGVAVVCFAGVHSAFASTPDPTSAPVPGPDVRTCPHCRAREVATREDCRFCGGRL